MEEAETKQCQTECLDCIHKKAPGNKMHKGNIGCDKPSISVRGEQWGVMNGFFEYPDNFNPVYKKTDCLNVETEQDKSNEIDADLDAEVEEPTEENTDPDVECVTDNYTESHVEEAQDEVEEPDDEEDEDDD